MGNNIQKYEDIKNCQYSIRKFLNRVNGNITLNEFKKEISLKLNEKEKIVIHPLYRYHDEEQRITQ